MKAKTIWNAWDSTFPGHWVDAPNKLWFAEKADVRWLNCFGLRAVDTHYDRLGSVRIVEGSKIIGDE